MCRNQEITKAMYRAGSCAACPGAFSGSVPGQKERFFHCLAASILPGAWGWGRGATGNLSLSTLHGLLLGNSAQEKVTTGGHLWELSQAEISFLPFSRGAKKLRTCCRRLWVKIKVHFNPLVQSISNLCEH